MNVIIRCPSCKSEFDASEAIRQQVEQQAAALVAGEKSELARKEEELTKAKAAIDAQVQQRVDAERAKLHDQALVAARDEVAAQIKAKEDEAVDTRKKLKLAQAKEVEFLKQKQALDVQAAELQLTVQRQISAERDAIRKAVLAQAEEQRKAELATKEQELGTLRAAVQTAKGKEEELAAQAAALAQAQAALEANVQKQVDAARTKLGDQALATAREEVAAELKAKEDEAAETRRKLLEAQAKELDFLKQKQALDDKTAELELNIQRKLDEERQQIRQDATAKAQEQMTLTVRERDLLIERMKTEMDGLQRKLNQGSQQAQGEAQELLLEEQLRQAFPEDSFREVATGAEGADLIEVVRDQQGRECGAILWESKRTKNWSDAWLGKLQSDRAREHATIAALATQALPKGVNSIGQVRDVWVCAFSHAVPMAMLLRQGMQEAASARKSLEGQKDKMSLLYGYLTGGEFRGRVTAVLHAWDQMLNNLTAERRAMERLWAERERLLRMAMGGMQGLHGDLQTIAGSDINVLPASNEGIRQLEAVASVSATPDTPPAAAAPAAVPPSADDTPMPASAIGGLSPLTQEQREAQFLATLTAFGGKAGNKTLRQALGFPEVDYDETKRRLLAKNQILVGKGGGGSVLLPSANPGGEQ